MKRLPFFRLSRAKCVTSDQQQPLFPHPPQQKRRRMIQIQLSQPDPLLLRPKPLPPHPPQQQSRMMSHRQEDIPFPLSHPHPQFVAVKSLMLNPPIRFCLQFYSMQGKRMCALGTKTGSGNILIKKGFIMRWVKQTVNYWCNDIIEENYTGEGICAAILDTGISRHPDLEGRIEGFKDFTGNSMKYHDDSGHGTHVAGIFAGSGKVSNGLYAGMAPRAGMLIGKVLDREGNGNVENVLRGIDWVLREQKHYGVRIVNISVGTQPDLAERQKQLFLDAVDRLWDSGMVVVVSAGNYGPGEGTVAVPGSSRKVITVGVPDAELPLVRKRKKNTNYSGRGPTAECVVKPDVFAPGTGIISCNGKYGRPGEHPYTMKTGTSMATPVVSGAIACLLSKYPDMTNVEVKLKLRESSEKIQGTEAGWGMLNVERLMRV